MSWRTVGYRIEPAFIRQYPDCPSREVWFLDAVQVNTEGRRSTSNICSGERQYCIDTLNGIKQDAPEPVPVAIAG